MVVLCSLFSISVSFDTSGYCRHARVGILSAGMYELVYKVSQYSVLAVLYIYWLYCVVFVFAKGAHLQREGLPIGTGVDRFSHICGSLFQDKEAFFETGKAARRSSYLVSPVSCASSQRHFLDTSF